MLGMRCECCRKWNKIKANCKRMPSCTCPICWWRWNDCYPDVGFSFPAECYDIQWKRRVGPLVSTDRCMNRGFCWFPYGLSAVHVWRNYEISVFVYTNSKSFVYTGASQWRWLLHFILPLQWYYWCVALLDTITSPECKAGPPLSQNDFHITAPHSVILLMQSWCTAVGV